MSEALRSWLVSGVELADALRQTALRLLDDAEQIPHGPGRSSALQTARVAMQEASRHQRALDAAFACVARQSLDVYLRANPRVTELEEGFDLILATIGEQLTHTFGAH